MNEKRKIGSRVQERTKEVGSDDDGSIEAFYGLISIREEQHSGGRYKSPFGF
jgi:hypothetical protein